MLRWSDLGASLVASPRLALRGDLWAQVLRRLFFSPVFLAYALIGLLLVLAGQPLLALAATTLLLPYLVWAITAPVAMVLPEYLALPPPEVDAEPPFVRYLLWNMPLFVLAVLVAVVSLLPGLESGWPRATLGWATALLAAPAALKMATRGTLSAYYDNEASRAFMAATRWSRPLVAWPLVLGLVALVVFGAPRLGAQPLAQQAWAALPWQAWAALAAIALVAVVTLAGIAFTGAILGACARIPSDSFTSSQDTAMATAIDERMGTRSVMATRPMIRTLAAPDEPERSRWAPVLRACGGLVVLAGVIYLARLPLIDTYLDGDASYRAASVFLDRLQGHGANRLGPSLDAAVVSDRLRAGYIAAACNGDLEQARLLAQMEVPQPLDHARLLACAACSGERATVDWLLAAQPELRADQVVIATDGDARRPRTALSCAARSNDLGLARALLLRGGKPRDLEGAASSIAVAASRQHWDMVRLLLQRDRSAAPIAAFAAMDGAFARDPKRPAEVLDQLLAAGVPPLVVDRQGRNLFHWAGMRHDLRLAQALLQRSGSAPADQTLAHADAQGALPWMYVLRRAELSGQPLSEEATELLRLLLPPGADVNVALRKPMESGSGEAFPAGWTAATVAVHQPAALEVLGPGLDLSAQR
ncbi:ankyrin repeat domain-containing protein [Ramlibacter sp. XY19]|uniref:ankyrin repeat domain-containing protein n=1 Tax=Ramlibacter paludis TaxID=2908000 RepID=UPI0023DABBED|nr:ankyrin repeat domain-containing protein [Ramlibacter paludis]MCG2594686.1 ankyrin repeat domain-containing protein [Ramlibacter paludis]